MTGPGSGRSAVLALVGVSIATLGGCGSPAPLRVEPNVVRVSPRDLDVRVDLVNDGPTDAAVADLRIEGEDWTAFAIQDDRNPDRVPAGARVPLTVRVTRRAFAQGAHERAYVDYRPGRATLALRLDDEPVQTALEFEPEARFTDAIWAALISLALLWASLWGAGGVRDSLWRRFPVPDAGPGSREGASTSPLPRARAITLALGVGALAAAWATIPIGDAVCLDRLGDYAGRLDLAQCRTGFAGGPLSLAAVDGGVAVWWAALVAFLATTFVGRRDRRARTLGDTFGPLAVIALAAAGPCIVHGSLDPGTIVRAQIAEDHSVAIWAWGAFSQPVGAILATLALARLQRASPEASDQRSGIPASRLGPHALAAAAVVTLFFGGWSVPVLPTVSHLASLLLGAAAFAVKLGLLSFVVAHLAARAERSPLLPASRGSAGSADSTGWLFLLALALANLGATIAILAT